MDKEDLFEKRMRELGKKAYYRGILTFSDFLDLNQQNILHSLSFRDTGIKVETLEAMSQRSVRWRHSSLRLFLMSRIIPLPV